MERSKLEKAVRELAAASLARGRTLVCPVSGHSMLFLLADGDEVVVRRAPPVEIAAGDIIVWDAQRGKPGKPVVHRVLAYRERRGRREFLTKGDCNARSDRFWVASEHIIGKVTAIRKTGITIDIDRFPGRLLSRTAEFVTGLAVSAAALALLPFVRLRDLLPERPCRFDPQALLCHPDADLPAWEGSTAQAEEFLRRIAQTPGAAVADLQRAGGFSEEALCLMRRGMPVAALSFIEGAVQPREAYDAVLAARLVNRVPAVERANLIRQVLSSLKPGGRAFFSWIDPDPGELPLVRRAFWAALLGGRYRGPRDGELVRDGVFVKTLLAPEDLSRELADAGAAVTDLERDHTRCALTAEKTLP